MRVYASLLGVVCTVCLGATFAFAQSADDPLQTEPYNKHHDRHMGHDHVYPDRGSLFRDLPKGTTIVNYAGLQYRFYNGVWFEPRGPAFFVVMPPIGVVVPQLPAFATSFESGGQSYLYANDVFYAARPELGGYEVVNDPSDMAPAAKSRATAASSSSATATPEPAVAVAPGIPLEPAVATTQSAAAPGVAAAAPGVAAAGVAAVPAVVAAQGATAAAPTVAAAQIAPGTAAAPGIVTAAGTSAAPAVSTAFQATDRVAALPSAVAPSAPVAATVAPATMSVPAAAVGPVAATGPTLASAQTLGPASPATVAAQPAPTVANTYTASAGTATLSGGAPVAATSAPIAGPPQGAGTAALPSAQPVAATAPAANPTRPQRVTAYPKNGQSADQQARDHYECYQFGVAQSGYDPMRPTFTATGMSSGQADFQRAQVACFQARGYTIQ
jgi:hypothetical protein